MHAPHSWSQRFLAALVPPSDRAMVLFMLVMVFWGGMIAGAAQRSAREVDRIIAQVPSRPTLHQRLDAIDQRLQAIEQRLTP